MRQGGVQGSSATDRGPLLLGLGMATVDFLTLVPRLPGPDEVFPLQRLDMQGGGPVATALAAAARLGTGAAFAGAVGDDHWGDAIVDDFGRFGVNVDEVVRRRGGVSPHSVILVDAASGKRSILYSNGDVRGLEPAELPERLIGRAAVLHLDGFDIDAALEAARIARAAGVPVSLDGGAGEPWPGLLDLLPLVDLLVVAAQFAESVTGEKRPESALTALRRWGARQVVITDGARGAWFLGGEGDTGHVPAFDVEVVDTTGAGDTFHGAYLHAFLAGESIAGCVLFASAAAALKCTRLGGRAGLPTSDQVEAFLAASAAGR
ncbi:MAG: PfkB family carbohydrate kinase [Trueperaceae bacterium]